VAWCLNGNHSGQPTDALHGPFDRARMAATTDLWLHVGGVVFQMMASVSWIISVILFVAPNQPAATMCTGMHSCHCALQWVRMLPTS
jgi:hypothetical protein